MGTVNMGTSGAACWCGNQISYVTVMAGLLGANSVSGEAGERTCIGVRYSWRVTNFLTRKLLSL